ncbi:MAG: hypothetical protein CMM93_04420 [Rickettsiales bacterium]|nr:hypothetical protein [Rickettsiales bacterium]|tara:strand:+ start:146 stop:1123 length:978 start_codon:yes stop_codon:yes gene_type:complete
MEDIVKYCEEENIKTTTVDVFSHACGNGHLDIIKLFLSNDRDSFPLRFLPLDCYGYRPFAHACSEGKLDVVEFLLANIEQFENSSFRFKININENKDYAFAMACVNGHLDVVKFLLEYAEKNNLEIDLNANDGYALGSPCGDGRLDIVKFLLDYAEKHGLKIDINADYNFAFLSACDSGHLDIIQFLLDYAKTNNLELGGGDSAFGSSCARGKLDMAKFILEHMEIDINSHNDRAFKMASENGHQNIIDFLLPLLNQRRDAFYYCKRKQYYIVKTVDCETRSTTKIDDFFVYHKKSDYLNDCIEAYEVYLRRFRKKSAFSMIEGH